MKNLWPETLATKSIAPPQNIEQLLFTSPVNTSLLRDLYTESQGPDIKGEKLGEVVGGEGEEGMAVGCGGCLGQGKEKWA